MQKNKNMIPSFSRGSLANLQKALEDGIVTAPAFHFITDDDKKCLAYVDIDGVVYELGMNRIEELEEKMTVLNESMGDLNNITDIIPPETGATNIVEYISSINEAVNNVSNTVTMLTSGALGNDNTDDSDEDNTDDSDEDNNEDLDENSDEELNEEPDNESGSEPNDNVEEG